MPVIFCLLPSSSIVILVFTYLLQTSVNSMCENCDWVWTQFTGLMLPFWGTPVNNPITFISPVQWGLHFLPLTVYAYSSVNFRTVFSESQNANPFDAELEPDFKAKWPFKVTRFGVNENPLRGYIVQYNNCGLECEGSEHIPSERSENRHLRRPHCHLTPPLQQTPVNIQINITSL